MKNKPLNTQFAFLRYIRKLYLVNIPIFILLLVILKITKNDGEFNAFVIVIFLFSLYGLIFTLSISFLKPITLISNYKVDIDKKILKVKRYPVITMKHGEFSGWRYILSMKTADIPIGAIGSIQRYKKYFVVTRDTWEFLLPITKDTENLVLIHNEIFKNLIGRRIRITDAYNAYNEIVIYAKITDTQECFDGCFQDRLIIAEAENDVIMDNQNYGRTLILYNRYDDSYTEDRTVQVNRLKNEQDLHHIYDKSKPLDMDYFLMGCVELL